MKKEKEYYFNYNSPISCKTPIGMKRGHVTATDKKEAKIKINEFIQKIKGELCSIDFR